MARQPRMGNPLSSGELADRATDHEVHLRARGRATKALKLVSGMARADAALKAERGPIRAQATALVEPKSAAARGNAEAAKQATPSPRAAAFGRGCRWFISLNACGPWGRGRGALRLSRHGAKAGDQPTRVDPAIMTPCEWPLIC